MDRVLCSAEGAALLVGASREAVVEAVRTALADIRERLRAGEKVAEAELREAAVAHLADRLLRRADRPLLGPVVNATGVVLHTNLGRALLCEQALEAVGVAAGAACNLEYDLVAGGRGERDLLVEEHLVALTGAEAATIVNNNAAALLISLNTLAEGREVVVSRGELIEIGGSFRIPDVTAKSGALMREVGTTNRTHIEDYIDATRSETALYLKVHTSNYRIVGFTASVEVRELVKLADLREDLYVVEDLGAGALIDLESFGLPREPVVGDRVAAGVDLVTFSGDKLLGGPQCGVIVGKRELVDKIRGNPLKRALRCDKMTLAALEATLRVYRLHPRPQQVLPTLRYLTRGPSELEELGRRAVEELSKALGREFEVSLEPSVAQVGSGAQPETGLESRAVVVESMRWSAEEIAVRFRTGSVAVVGRIENDRFLLDLIAVSDPLDLVPQSP